MSLRKNFQDVLRAVLPIVALVLIASLGLVRIPGNHIRDFLIGACCIILGLSIFLTGISLGVERIVIGVGESLCSNFLSNS